MTIKEVAAGFGVTDVTVHRWRERDQLPFYSLAGNSRHSVRFALEDIQAWAESRNRPFTPPPRLTRLAHRARAATAPVQVAA